MQRLLGFLGGCAAVGAAIAQTPVPAVLPPRPIPAVEHVLIISVDGLRPDLALLADMPTLRAMVRGGAYSFWARTTALATTLPSHASMLTGVTPRKHGIEWNADLPFGIHVYSKVPTIFEIATQAGYTTAMVAGKAKLVALARPGTITHAFIPVATKDNDEHVGAEAVRMIEQHRPDLLFVHFPESDAVGHAKGWGSPEHLAGLAGTDRMIAQVLHALEDAKMLASTVVIVTADHGGAGLNHGPGDPRSGHIPWLISGPGVRPNFDLTRVKDLQVNTEDTAATALWLLGLPRPANLDGQPVLAAFAKE